MSDLPLISVVMPCYNASGFLREAVESVLGQRYPHKELVVVDDGSTDGSLPILEGYGGRITLLQQPNRGPYPARNRGLRHIQGDLVAFLDADDYWDPACLERLQAALGNTGADVAYCGWQNVGIPTASARPYVPPDYASGDLIAGFLKGCPWPIHAALVRRPVLDAVGGFSERYFSSMDYDLWLRLAAVTRRMVRVPEVLAYYRWHDEGQISAVRWRQALDAWRVRRDFASEHPQAVAHLARGELRGLVDGALWKAAHRAYWMRDLGSAQKLYRRGLLTTAWTLADLRYALPSLLPLRLYRAIVSYADSRNQTD